MFRATSTAAVAVLAALVLAGCGAASAPEPASASAPAASPTANETAPAESAPAESPSADAGAPDRAACEAVLLEQFDSWSPRAATDDDLAAAADAMMLVLPGRPTCGVMVNREDRPANQIRIVWLDQPAVAPELVRVLDTRGWESSHDDTAGVDATTYTDGELEVLVAAIGVDNAQAGWDSIWPGADITLVSVETP